MGQCDEKRKKVKRQKKKKTKRQKGRKEGRKEGEGRRKEGEGRKGREGKGREGKRREEKGRKKTEGEKREEERGRIGRVARAGRPLTGRAKELVGPLAVHQFQRQVSPRARRGLRDFKRSLDDCV